MRSIRLHCRRISLWIILIFQLILIGSYFLLQTENANTYGHNLNSKVLFLQPHTDLPISKVTYQTITSKVTLKSLQTSEVFVDYNSSLCYKLGTDLNLTKRSKSLIWKCNCLPGWHSNDCGQPEVIWRALLAHRKPLLLKGPRKYQRRIIYLLEVDEFASTTIDIRVNELNSVVDLFVLYENESSTYLENKLTSNFLLEYHYKILYIKGFVWKNVKGVITNLKDDDIVLVGGPNDIPNKLALQFLKLYDKWPEPLIFRYRWSVYGFFWLHPSKTILKGGASSVLYLYDFLHDQSVLLHANKSGLIIGDLNHFGGWFCEFCYDSLKIIDFLKARRSSIIKFDVINKNTVDNSYVEDLIENGIYLDGKTELVRVHRYNEKYYAPNYVVNNSWKYDWLLINLYSKMDYY